MPVFNLHTPIRSFPHTFKGEEPVVIDIAVRVETDAGGCPYPTPEVDISVRSFVNVSALSQDLRDRIAAEVSPEQLQYVLETRGRRG